MWIPPYMDEMRRCGLLPVWADRWAFDRDPCQTAAFVADPPPILVTRFST
jgi:hypothetical protein